jgi:hypothetical protein
MACNKVGGCFICSTDEKDKCDKVECLYYVNVKEEVKVA